MIKIINKIKILSMLLVIIVLNSCQSYITALDETTNAQVEGIPVDHKYIINTRSGKVHTYSHGMNIIENKDYAKESDDSIDVILSNEKYDICHTCHAGLLVDDNVNRYDIDLIEKYMRLYDFVQIEPSRAEFLMSIFTVGNWYVNNVYTYQGGSDTVIEVENNAKKYASKNAYKRWQDYKDSYSESFKIADNKHIIPVVYDSDNKPSSLALFECDIFKGKYARGDSKYTRNDKKDLFTYDKERLGSGYKNDYVVDDCSKFAAAVYYHYINNTILKNKKIEEKDGLGIDLWTTGSKSFDNIYSNIGKILLKTKRFEIDNIKEINQRNINLEIGDLIYRKEKAHYKKENNSLMTDIPGHVEFYIGNNRYVGWGKIQDEGYISKKLTKKSDGFYSDYENDYNQPYITIIKFKGED